MSLPRSLYFVLLLVFFSQSINALGYRNIICGIVANVPFAQELFATLLEHQKEQLKQGGSTVSLAEEQFVRQTINEQNVPHAQNLDISYAPKWLEGWSSLAYKNTIEVPHTKKESKAYIPKKQKSKAALLDKYRIVTLERASKLSKMPDCLSIILLQNIAGSKYIDMELDQALKYKNFISKKLKDCECSFSLETKNVYQKALASIEITLEYHRGALMHEVGHIVHEDGTRKSELKSFCKYTFPTWMLSIGCTILIQKYAKLENPFVSSLATYACSQILCTSAQIYARRKEETNADDYAQRQGLESLHRYFKIGRLYLHQKVKDIVGAEAYSILCKNQCMERFFNFILDPLHPSVLARIQSCKSKLRVNAHQEKLFLFFFR